MRIVLHRLFFLQRFDIFENPLYLVDCRIGVGCREEEERKEKKDPERAQMRERIQLWTLRRRGETLERVEKVENGAGRCVV